MCSLKIHGFGVLGLVLFFFLSDFWNFKKEGNSALSVWLSLVVLMWPYLELGAVAQGSVEMPSKDLCAQRSVDF